LGSLYGYVKYCLVRRTATATFVPVGGRRIPSGQAIKIKRYQFEASHSNSCNFFDIVLKNIPGTEASGSLQDVSIPGINAGFI